MIENVCFLILTSIMLFALYRNTAVMEIRTHYIFEDEFFPQSYKMLPSQASMTFNPRYYGLWTIKQWNKWIEKNNT